MESTKQNPLAYFEFLITSNGLAHSLSQYLEGYVIQSGLHITDVDNIKGIVRYYEYDNDGNNIREIESCFEHTLTNQIYKEFNNSKSLINEVVSEMTKEQNDYTAFLLLQQKSLQYIVNNGIKNLELFPVLLKPINGIANYINTKYLYENEQKIVVNIPVLNIEESKSDVDDISKIIISILGYLSGNNDNRQKIMSDDQFELMIGYVKYYVEKNAIPESIQKLDHIKISKNLLCFTFWVLHKRLYNIRPKRQDFIELMKQMFSDFDSWETSTLRTKFGAKYKVTHNGKRFIPDIIKSELQKFE